MTRRIVTLVCLAAVVATALSVAGMSGAGGWVIRDLGTFGALHAAPTSINDRGQILVIRVGKSESTARSLLWENGRVQALGTLAGGATGGRNINDRGQVVGASEVSGQRHAFLWQDGKMRDLGRPTGDVELVEAVAINERGQIAMRAGGPDVVNAAHAYLWSAGRITDLGTLGGKGSSASDINNNGQIVGMSMSRSGQMHAVVWTLTGGS